MGKGTTKTLSCDITVVFNGNEIALGPEGDIGKRFYVNVKFDLSKAKNKLSSTTKMKNIVFEKQDEDIEDPTSPVDLWCPAENTIIWTPEHDFVDESSLNSWQECAELCATLVNENGNAPCFSWTYNNAAEEKYGLPTGVCRLLPYSPVYRMEAMDVQSGYWKCWNAYQDYNA